LASASSALMKPPVTKQGCEGAARISCRSWPAQKGLACASQHDGTCRLVVGDQLELGLQRLEQAFRQRVEGMWRFIVSVITPRASALRSTRGSCVVSIGISW
jgi:hypothetical protein